MYLINIYPMIKISSLGMDIEFVFHIHLNTNTYTDTPYEQGSNEERFKSNFYPLSLG